MLVQQEAEICGWMMGCRDGKEHQRPITQTGRITNGVARQSSNAIDPFSTRNLSRRLTRKKAGAEAPAFSMRMTGCAYAAICALAVLATTASTLAVALASAAVTASGPMPTPSIRM